MSLDELLGQEEVPALLEQAQKFGCGPGAGEQFEGSGLGAQQVAHVPPLGIGGDVRTCFLDDHLTARVPVQRPVHTALVDDADRLVCEEAVAEQDATVVARAGRRGRRRVRERAGCPRGRRVRADAPVLDERAIAVVHEAARAVRPVREDPRPRETLRCGIEFRCQHDGLRVVVRVDREERARVARGRVTCRQLSDMIERAHELERRAPRQ